MMKQINFHLSDGRTQHSNERGARALYFSSFHSTMSVGVWKIPNIYETPTKGAIFVREEREKIVGKLRKFERRFRKLFGGVRS
jgi:hypothetical protein